MLYIQMHEPQWFLISFLTKRYSLFQNPFFNPEIVFLWWHTVQRHVPFCTVKRCREHIPWTLHWHNHCIRILQSRVLSRAKLTKCFGLLCLTSWEVTGTNWKTGCGISFCALSDAIHQIMYRAECAWETIASPVSHIWLILAKFH